MIRFIVKTVFVLFSATLLRPAYGQISAGDIAVIGMNGGPDSGTAAHNDEFAIVALADLPGSTQIFLADFGSNGPGLVTGQAFDALEGTVTWTTPASGVGAGTVLVFSIPNATNNLSVSPNLGSFSVSGWTSTSASGSPINNGAGDNIFVYTGSAASPSFIYGFINSATPGSPSATEDWHADAGAPQKSQLPTALLNSNGVNTATAHAMNSTLHKDNMVYTGTYSGTKAEILAAIGNTSNWTTDDANPVDLSVGGSTFSGSNPVFSITSPAPTSATVSTTVFLEGAFNGTNLNNSINSSIPTSQPYSGADFNNHTGTESGSVPSGAVDWVLVELREAASAATALNATKVGSAAGFLMNDGSIKATNGTDDLTVALSGNSGAEFFVVIYHRNHLPIMSAAAIAESGDTYSIDFTSLATNTFENTDALVALSGGKFAMPAGDTDADGDIDVTDRNIWKINNGGVFTYSGNGVADFNLDGVINAVDRNDFQKKNSLKVRKVPTN